MPYKLLAILGLWLSVIPMADAKCTFTLKNSTNQTRVNEPVVFSRATIDHRFGKHASDQVPALKADGHWLPMQLDDIDGDGRWDELAFTATIEAQSDIIIEMIWLKKEKAPVFPTQARAYLAWQNSDGTFTEVNQAEAPVGLAGFPTRYQSEGVGWENDKMAFRVYFDCRNIKDLFGKRVPDLILDRAGAPGNGSYHELAPWGMDILHCGSSLGAGGLALVEGDSLYRLGSTSVYQYHKIADGPVRTLFNLKYQGWTVNGKTYEAIEQIALWVGKYWFRSDVTIREFSGEKQLATGIVTAKLDHDPIEFQANTDFNVLLTHGKQSLNNDILAMAVMAPSKGFIKTGKTSNLDFYQLGNQTVPEKQFSQAISQTSYVCQKISNNTPSMHYFFAFWGLENKDWNREGAVKDYICSEANNISHPVRVEYEKDRSVFKKRTIKQRMEAALLWQLEHPRHELSDWTNGAFYAGVMAAYETTGSPWIYQALLKMGSANGWQPGKRLQHADDHAICQTYIDLYRLAKDPKMLQPTIDTLNKMMATPYRPKGIQQITWWWCDALFMGPPAFVKLGMTLGDDRYLAFNDQRYRETVDLLWNPEDSLFARDLGYVWGYSPNAAKESNGKKVYWSRGNGWVMGGLVRILKELPGTYPNRGWYIDLYRKMAGRVASLQMPDGLWRASLLNPDSFPGGEASGSGFFCYALAWGINNGLLDKKTFLPVVEKAWAGLNALLTDEGYVGWVQPIGADPQKNFSSTSWEVYGTGAFLLAGSEVIKLKR